MKAGTKICCENGHPICEVGPRGLRKGYILKSDHFVNWQVKPFKNGELALCPICNGAVFQSSKYFGTRAMTPDGWRYADRLLDRARQYEIDNGIEGIR